MLDRLIDVFQAPRNVIQQSRTLRVIGNSLMQDENTVKECSPAVLEFIGTSACSGKTQVLYQIIILALLPQAYNDIDLNGKSSAVILLDISSKFSVLRLRDVAASYIASCISACAAYAIAPAEISSLIHDSFQHLHIFHPQSSLSLLATVGSLPSYLLSQPFSHFSAGRQVSALIISDLSFFQWQDRPEDEENAVVTDERSAHHSSLIQHYRSLISSLKQIQSIFSCTIISTRSSLSNPYYLPGNHLALRLHTPAVWNNFCTAQIILELVSVPKFGPGISAQEAESERARRQEAVDSGSRRGWVNWWSSDRWREDVREGVMRWESDCGGGMRFQIQKGITMSEY